MLKMHFNVICFPVLLILLLQSLRGSCAATVYGPCQLPNRGSESCIKLLECEYFSKMLTQSLTNSQRELIRGSRCGQHGSDILVCCPENQNRLSNSNDNQNLLPKYPACGTLLSRRIVGGNITNIDEFPWMALIEYLIVSSGQRSHLCGGALINNRYIVTAAHCLSNIKYRMSRVRLGEWDKTTNPDCQVDTRGKRDCAPGHVEFDVEEEIAHPNYDPNDRSSLNDIALLRLAQDVPMNDFVNPICLPLERSLQNEKYVNIAMEVAGWGNTERNVASNIKLKATITGRDIQHCRQKYASGRRTLIDSQLCVGGEKGIDSCKGDSGGPLMILKKVGGNNFYILSGVVSYGPTDCGQEDYPGVYTRVGAYMDWILEKIRP